MKVMVAAGGTGGHFYPGLAVAKELISRGVGVHFVARDNDFVLPLLSREGIPYDTIPAGGFRRSLSLSNLLSVGRLVAGYAKARRLMSSVGPDILLVMGGYLSVPPALAAREAGVPVVLHEQNAVPGLANRLLSRLAAAVAASMPGSEGKFGAKAVLTGNPVRPEFQYVKEPGPARHKLGLDEARRTLLVFGGSLGARSLNDMVAGALATLKGMAADWQVFHLTGPQEEERMKDAYSSVTWPHRVQGFCHDMALAYAAADAVICRAGASTISELALTRKPAILVPYPHATGNHQFENARVLVSAGAAEVREERDLDAGRLASLLGDFLTESSLAARRQAYSGVEVNVSAAAGRVADIVLDVAAGRNRGTGKE